jgi:hypothetical protein
MRYGMRYSTIHYWQTQAKNFRQYHGLGPALSMKMRYNHEYKIMDARKIAYLFIQLAEFGPEFVRVK